MIFFVVLACHYLVRDGFDQLLGFAVSINSATLEEEENPEPRFKPGVSG